MKAFEEHLGTECNLIVDCGNLKCKECTKIKAEGWRAALEHALKIMKEQPNARFVIEQELQE